MPLQMIQQFFTGSGIDEGKTMSGYYDTCSYGQVKLQPSQVKVVGPIQIPCSGYLNLPFTFPSGNGFDTKGCMNDNLLKWQYYLDSVAAKQGVIAGNYNHKVLLLPKGFVKRPGEHMLHSICNHSWHAHVKPM